MAPEQLEQALQANQSELNVVRAQMRELEEAYEQQARELTALRQREAQLQAEIRSLQDRLRMA
jgi:chromosome segregation ATPase